ncbi:MAG TPA: DUF6644 family protein [Terriglobales bacterium]|nr:DUF6644 family protein [Terriglobales bacterium]
MPFFDWLQSTPLAQWVSQSESIWAYPTILMRHTVGLALLVGANVAIDLRLLGVAAKVPLRELKILFRPFWAGLVINAITGVLLFIADAVRKSGQITFMLKLSFIFVGVGVFLLLRPIVLATEDSKGIGHPRARLLAMVSLFLWAAAITAGRLMAYIK